MEGLEQELLTKYTQIMRLKIYVDSDDVDLHAKYKHAAAAHNNKLLNNDYIDAGFDLFSPEEIDKTTHKLTDSPLICIDYNIVCAASVVTQTKYHHTDSLMTYTKTYNTGFYIYPRSSMSNTVFRLANHVGIIDAGYRGHIMAKLDIKDYHFAIIRKFDRLLQICAPNLMPIMVELVDTREQLGEPTARGVGGFGSTGK